MLPEIVSAYVVALGTGCATGATLTLHRLLRGAVTRNRNDTGEGVEIKDRTGNRAFLNRSLSSLLVERGSSSSLDSHPIFLLANDTVEIACVDPARALLFNDIKLNVLCHPVIGSARQLLESATPEWNGQRFFGSLRERQHGALDRYPARMHAFVAKILDMHRDSLETLLDLSETSSSREQLVTNPARFYTELLDGLRICTLSTVRRWSHLSGQLNGHLNGLVWNGSPLRYSHQGSMTELAQALHVGACVLEGVGPCFVVLSHQEGIVSVTSSVETFLGCEQRHLVGQAETIFRFGMDREESEDHRQGRTQIRVPGQSPVTVYMLHSTLFVSEPPRECRVALFLKGDVESTDAHTRFAFLLTLAASGEALATLSSTSDHVVKIALPEAGIVGIPVVRQGGSLTDQTGVRDERFNRLVDRCSRRLREDLVWSGSDSYRGVTCGRREIQIDAFLVGEDRAHLAAVHRLRQ
jgi:hypothetical protein